MRDVKNFTGQQPTVSYMGIAYTVPTAGSHDVVLLGASAEKSRNPCFWKGQVMPPSMASLGTLASSDFDVTCSDLDLNK